MKRRPYITRLVESLLAATAGLRAIPAEALTKPMQTCLCLHIFPGTDFGVDLVEWSKAVYVRQHRARFSQRVWGQSRWCDHECDAHKCDGT